MKKILLISVIATMMVAVSNAQSIDWNLRGGLNLMNSKTSGQDLALLYHLGIQAGMRINHFGIYGEVVYSMLEDQYGGEPIAYFAPAITGKGYVLSFMFVEMGGMLLSKIGESETSPDNLNPNNMILPFAGLGVHFSRVEISMRSSVKQSYGIIQLTGAVKF